MKVLKVIVDEIPEPGCMGRPEGDGYYPAPCEGVVVGEDLWCMFTGETIECNNDPHNTRPDWCPLVVENESE